MDQRQQQIRIQISTTLVAALYQTLIPRRDSKGRVVAVEIMIATDAVRNLIREGRTPQMWNAMQTGLQHGMQTMDQAIMHLYRNRIISTEEAVIRYRDPETAKKMLTRSEGSH